MKNAALLLLIVLFTFNRTSAQSPASDSLYNISQNQSKENIQNLYVLGKTWGFLKYFHPAVASGKFDWDKELISFLPGYAFAITDKERSELLMKWIDGLGNVSPNAAGNYDSIKDARLKPSFSWMNSKKISPALREKLQYILKNRARGDQYYIKFHRMEGLNIPEFLHENPYGKETYPNVALRLVSLFRFWNIIEYWYPYKYGLSPDWDAVLKKQVAVMLQAKDAAGYNKAIQQLNAALRDGHGFVRSRTSEELLGFYYMPFTFRFVEDKLIIASVTNDTTAAGLQKGVIITAVDGIAVRDIVKQKLPFVSESTPASAMYELARTLNRVTKENTVLSVLQNGQVKEITVKNFYTKKLIDKYLPDFVYQRDSSMHIFPGDILYLNMGKLLGRDSNLIRSNIEHSAALILDLRQNLIENGDAINPFWLISTALKEAPGFNIFTTQQPDFPGVFKFVEDTSQVKPIEYHYKKPVAVLINEGVISAGESMAMDFSRGYDVMLIGTPTSGTNGMNSFVMLPGNVATGFSGTGNYWPDKRNIQRIGVRPGIKVAPTVAGYKAGKDEVLEKAIEYLSGKKKN